MNTNHLKKFAREARIKLRAQVEAKLRQVLRTDSIALREKAAQVRELRRLIAEQGEKNIVEQAAYLWFNRFMALRFMDIKGYTKVRVVSPLPGDTLPEILQEAKNGNVADDLHLDRDRLMDLLDGKLPSDNPQNEAYQLLLVAACNHWSSVMPFLFQRIDDYSELLMPNDVLSAHSIIQDVREGMMEEAEEEMEVEVIGWLYQFYIAERKDEVFAAKGKVPKEDIPAATQLFTPRWIVEYMVQNTLGKLWLQNRPNSTLRQQMPYYIESATSTTDDFLRVQSVEDITLLDQACGSGHILAYAFDLFAKIYEEEGYDQSQIPLLILKNNLFGFEIDERAAQLAAMTLMMKARGYHRRVFRKKPMPQIMRYEDLRLSDEALETVFQRLDTPLTKGWLHDLQHLRQATNLGSLLLPQTPPEAIAALQSRIQAASTTADMFLQQQLYELDKATQQLARLARKYYCVVDNPPYMGGGKMNNELGDFVKKVYPKSKGDLMVCFMERAEMQLLENGLVGMINLPSWMFLSTFEKFRTFLIESFQIETLLHLGRGIFGSDFGTVAFTFRKTSAEKKEGVYRRLFKKHVQVRSVEKIRKLFIDKFYGYFLSNQENFKKIPGSSIGYWLSDNKIDIFKYGVPLEDLTKIRQGLASGKNDYFVRFWNEVSFKSSNFQCSNIEEALETKVKWFSFNKGGEKRKWTGNLDYVIRFDKKSYNLLSKSGNNLPSKAYYFKKAITWSAISSGSFSVRIHPAGSIFSNAGMVCLTENEDFYGLLSLLNSKVIKEILTALSPTLNYNAGDIKKIPILDEVSKQSVRLDKITNSCVSISNEEWNSHETSWDFQQNELVRLHEPGKTLELTYLKYYHYWREQFFQLHENEEELNRLFIGIYGLEDELTPDVPLSDITLLKRETSIDEAGELVFDRGEVMRQLVSYAVGCMMGRYSLDKPGLILANQGEDLDDYVAATGVGSDAWRFEPDDDGILPVLEEDYFVDDIVGRFRSFLKAAFGEAHFEENLRFVESGLGKEVRAYFLKDFYKDHLQRYKKRPIYWKFTSPNRSFSALLYLHRYRSDSVSKLLNDYLRSYVQKLEAEREGCVESSLSATISGREKGLLDKRVQKIEKVLTELQDWERSVVYPLATQKVTLNLDNGVLVNYNLLGDAVETVTGLNDAKARKKVAGFDWVE